MTKHTQARLICFGISRWKRQAVRMMLSHSYSDILFYSSAERALKDAQSLNATLAVWASRNNAALLDRAQHCGIPVLSIEDGFLRSVGLGAAFTKPCSLVADHSGIYYDPRTPSDLELLLKNTHFSPDLLARSERLLETMQALQITKYNIGTHSSEKLVPEGKYAVLVPGQVEDDASIRYGSPEVRTNRELLERARARHPEAFLIYKPHPDVAAGYRQGTIPFEKTTLLADCVITERSITDLYTECHHVETITSLAGFEALLRGLTVTTHGQPFYAGWGLTEDLLPHPRRGRMLTLPELVAATLLLYPRYMHPYTGQACEAEDVLHALADTSRHPSRLAKMAQHLYARSRHMLFGALDRRRRQ